MQVFPFLPKPSAAGPQTPMQVFFTCVIKIKELPKLALIMRQHFEKIYLVLVKKCRRKRVVFPILAGARSNRIIMNVC